MGKGLGGDSNSYRDRGIMCRLLNSAIVTCRGVDPYGTGGTRPPNIWTGGDIITNVPLNISGVISATFYPCNIFLIS